MKFLLNLSFLLSLVKYSEGAGGAVFSTYYEKGGLGPSQWDFLDMVDNQCSGTCGASGYGQSPVNIPSDVAGASGSANCDTTFGQDYEFNAGTCTYSDLEYTWSNGGVKVAPKAESNCVFGSMRIPHIRGEGEDTVFTAAQFHIHTSSEHTIDGEYFPAELHVVHVQNDGSSFAVFGTMIDAIDDVEHVWFENYLRGWESHAMNVDYYCKDKGSETSFTLIQKEVECKAVGDNWPAPAQARRELAASIENKFPPEFTTTDTINLYTNLPNNQDFGIYTLKGGLTTPPCTEAVNWNLLDQPMMISLSQLERLKKLILCYTNEDTCVLSTVASESGSTSRPPQPLDGRKVTHRCPNTSGVVYTKITDVGTPKCPEPEPLSKIQPTDDDQFDSSSATFNMAFSAMIVAMAGVVVNFL